MLKQLSHDLTLSPRGILFISIEGVHLLGEQRYTAKGTLEVITLLTRRRLHTHL